MEEPAFVMSSLNSKMVMDEIARAIVAEKSREEESDVIEEKDVIDPNQELKYDLVGKLG